MEGIEKQAPAALVEYSAWWSKTYGKETTPEEIDELIGFAKALKEDQEFQNILNECIFRNLYSNPRGGEWNDVTYQETLLTEALSTYGQKFGLRVD